MKEYNGLVRPGLEEAIPDMIARRGIRQEIASPFRNGDCDEGIAGGVAQLTKRMEGGRPQPDQVAGRT